MKLSYRTAGDSLRPTLLFLHGFLGGSNDWMDVAAQLSGDYFCIMPDLPGHGASISHDAEQYTFESTAQSLLMLTVSLGISNLVLIGYSMGGRIALYTALQHPEICSGVILESASPGLRSDRERQQRVAEDEKRIERLNEIGASAFVEEWYSMSLFDSIRRDNERLERLIAEKQRIDREGIALSLRGAGTGTQVPLWDRLHELSVPVLLVIGDEDSKFRDINRKMIASLKYASLMEVPNTGHNVHFEQLGLFCHLTRKFISKSRIFVEEIDDNVER